MYKKIQKSLQLGSLVGVIVLLNAQPSVSVAPLDDCVVGRYPSSTSYNHEGRKCVHMRINVGDELRCKAAIVGTYGNGENRDYEIFFPNAQRCEAWMRACPLCDAKGKEVIFKN